MFHFSFCLGDFSILSDYSISCIAFYSAKTNIYSKFTT